MWLYFCEDVRWGGFVLGREFIFINAADVAEYKTMLIARAVMRCLRHWIVLVPDLLTQVDVV